MLELFSRTIVPGALLSRDVWDRLDPFRVLDAADPLLWWREGEWMVGRGRLLTLQFSGPNRFAEAASTWADLSTHATAAVNAATLEESVTHARVSAFSSFAFADESPTPSVIIVPELLIGYKDGQFWATRVWAAEDRDVEADVVAAQVRALAEYGSDVRTEGRPTQAGVSLTAGEATRADHEKAVRRALELIEAAHVSKVVVAREARAIVDDGFDVRAVLARLTRAYPTCWVFAVDGFFGASPETLVEVHSGELHARVLAGTQARPQFARAGQVAAVVSLLEDPKERNEHEFAVQSVVEVISEHAIDPHVDGPRILELANVWHLATDVTASVEDSDLLEIVGQLHPTAAVAGVPREAALDAISALEIEDRGRYAGPVGWLDSSDDGEWAVGIRSAQLRGNTVTAWAGGGIVEGSVPADEFEETEAKLAPIRDALAE